MQDVVIPIMRLHTSPQTYQAKVHTLYSILGPLYGQWALLQTP